MDVPRERPRRHARNVGIVLALAVAIAATGTVAARAKDRPIGVRRAAIWTGKVERSPFVVRVKGPGTLLPEAVRWLTAETSGRVEEVLRKPGAVVEDETGIVRLENLDIRLQAVQADRDVATGHSELLALGRRVREDEISEESDALQLRTSFSDAARRADVYARSGGMIVSGLDTKRAGDQASELERRAALADEKLGVLRQAGPEQLDALRTQVGRSAEVSRVRHELVEHLLVRAGAKGVLQDVLVELGQWVVPGTIVAKVIVSDRLKAELRIPEEQAGGLTVGQVASLDTRSGSISGHVRRVAAAASQGSVKVEVALEGEMPRGTRPDQSVDGYVETDRTEDTLHIPRPVSVPAKGTASVFRVDPATGIARRVDVRTGRASVDALEILSGLNAGDEVILSDMAPYANVEVVQME